ncbi:MAG: DUF1592 domain-containing protein [Planctomycetota bacterium]
MPNIVRLNLLFCLVAFITVRASAGELRGSLEPLLESSCVGCHDSGTETGLDLTEIPDNLADPDTFRVWERVFDRVATGEMPPESEERPDPDMLRSAMDALRESLSAASTRRQQTVGRVPARRLTKLELGYTLADLFDIQGEVVSNVPDEVESGSFDTVGASQRISGVHLRAYLDAANEAIGEAIRLEPNPFRRKQLDFEDSPFLNSFHEKPLQLGGSVTRRVEGEGVALFRDADYLITSSAGGFNVPVAGVYRLTSELSAYQSEEPITAKIIRKQPSGSATLLCSEDLEPGKTETISVDVYLKPGDTFYTTLDIEEPFGAIMAAGGSKDYRGPGLLIKKQGIAGPITESWPPPSTQLLLEGAEIVKRGAWKRYDVRLKQDAAEAAESTLKRYAKQIFRRNVEPEELAPYLELARKTIEEQRPYRDTIQTPLVSMLSSPSFLLFSGEPGELSDHALASRLSYFLWKSLPDAELMELADEGKLVEPRVLAEQVDRMLADEKSQRFVRDFLGQWLRLDQINATSPDEKLYPEYDELLGDAMPKETELFFSELIRENLGVSHLIDSEFTFLNRRLAEHYRIPGIKGQHFRRVELPEGGPRGGVLTHASVMKTTANGTVTSPVTRGNFVLTAILGTPPSPPPPSVGSIEPDTRGETTIREILSAHRDVDSCSKCHREIDPPGFALECFDPIGRFRTHYRATGNGGGFAGFLSQMSYHKGPPVDSSGVTADGKAFDGIAEFKQLLLERHEQIAKNVVQKLVVYSTGAEIQFADRQLIQTILDATRDDGFRIRDLIHRIVQSDLFRQK